MINRIRIAIVALVIAISLVGTLAPSEARALPKCTGICACGDVANHLNRMARVARMYWQLGMVSEYTRVMEVYNRAKAWYDKNCR